MDEETSDSSYILSEQSFTSPDNSMIVESSDEVSQEYSSVYEDYADRSINSSSDYIIDLSGYSNLENISSGSSMSDANSTGSNQSELELNSLSYESSNIIEQPHFEDNYNFIPEHEDEEEFVHQNEFSYASEQYSNSTLNDGANHVENINDSRSVNDSYESPSSADYSIAELIGDVLEDDNEADFNFRFQQVRDLIMDEEAREIINARCNINTIEMWLGILKLSLVHGLTTSATADLCKLINIIFGEKIIGETRYRIDQLFNPQEGVQLHATCPDCKVYLGQFTKRMLVIRCHICEVDVDLKNPSYTDFFIVFDIRNDIKNTIEANSTFYSNIVMNRQQENDNLQWSHITDGLKYKQFRQSLPDDKNNSYVTLTFNSDGAPVFVSSKFSIWPIQLVVNEVDQRIRNKQTIIHSVWFGHDKPNMTHFLQIFVDSMNHYSESGILCSINGEQQRIYVYAICCCVDSAARPPMQGIIQYNGYYGCSWCLHPGVRVFHGRGSSIKYTLLDEIPARRTADETFQHIEDAMNSRLPIYGMKKASPLLNLNGFDIIDGFVPDSMHCVDLGIAKKFMEYWFESTNTPYSAPKLYFNQLDAHIKSFRVPTQLMRLSRSLTDWKYWKAKEFENWVLFYSSTLLSEIVEFREYLHHWTLLVEAYHLLLQDTINLEDVQRADRLLRTFVADTEYLYGAHAMTYNVHQLLHLPQSVMDWGPLWSHNGYTFESGNYRILRSVHAAKGVLSQVCRNLSLNQSVQLLQEYVHTMEDSPMLDFVDHLQNKFTQKTMKLGENRYFGACRPLLDVNELPIQDIVIPRAFERMVRNSSLFRSCRRRCYRSDNSCTVLNDGNYVRIQQFIVDPNNRAQYVVFTRMQAELNNRIDEELTSISRVTEEDEQLQLCLVQEMDKLCVFMNMNSRNYISIIPNMYW